MVRRVGFRFGNLRRAADFQSMNSVESCSAQNLRSLSSDRKSGTGLFFVLGIDIAFLLIHVSNRYYTHQRAPDGECHEQESPRAGLAERIVPSLYLGVPNVAAHYQRFVEKYIFGLFRSDSVPLPV